MNFTPRPLRHEENVLIELKNLVCASWCAERDGVGGCSRRTARARRAGRRSPTRRRTAGRIAPPLVTFQPGGSWMLTCPASMVLVVRDDDDFELLPHPAVNARTSSDADREARPGARLRQPIAH